MEEEFFKNSNLISADMNGSVTTLYKWTHTYALLAEMIKDI